MTKGERIKQERREAGLTQKKLGELSGTSETSIKQYENEKGQPRIEQLEKIADALNTTIAELMGLTYKENIMDTNDVFNFYNSLGYIVRSIDESNYSLISRDVTNHIRLILTWEELEKIKHDTWKYLKFTLNNKLDESSQE